MEALWNYVNPHECGLHDVTQQRGFRKISLGQPVFPLFVLDCRATQAEIAGADKIVWATAENGVCFYKETWRSVLLVMGGVVACISDQRGSLAGNG